MDASTLFITRYTMYLQLLPLIGIIVWVPLVYQSVCTKLSLLTYVH